MKIKTIFRPDTDIPHENRRLLQSTLGYQLLMQASASNIRPFASSKDVEEHKGYRIGDIIRIRRTYFEPGHREYRSYLNSVMLDVVVPIDRITVYEDGRDTLWCGKFSTSSTDYANLGIIK